MSKVLNMFSQISEEKLLSVIAMVVLSLIAMPLVGIYMICKKEASITSRVIGMVLLVVGVIIMMKSDPSNILI